MRAKAIIVLTIGLAAIAALVFYERRSAEISKIDRGSYFRLKVGLTYKNKPIDFDIVVGCGVHYNFNTGTGGSTDEVMGMTALHFAARMPEGHAVVIRTIPSTDTRFCHGATTANGDISAHWLPLITWYQRDDEFAHGIGYVTRDAYENPNAKFGFRGATIEHATRADFEVFQKKGPQNLWPPYLTDWITHEDAPRITDAGVHLDELAKHPSTAWRLTGWPSCRDARRIRLTDEQRKKVRALWPPDRPHFWSLPTRIERVEAYRKLLTPDQVRIKLHKYDPGSQREAAGPEVYPIRVDNTLSELSPKTPANDAYVQQVLIEPALLGFAYCDSDAPFELVQAVTGHKATLNAERTTCRVGNYTIPNQYGCGGMDLFWVVFEDDQFAVFDDEILTN